MTPQTQTIFANDPDGVYGNCMQAAIASMLDLPLKAVPHFALFEFWGPAARMWFEGRGQEWVRVDSVEPGQIVMAVGMSPRGVSHAVVWGAQGLVHDPHPDTTGLVGAPRYLYAIRDRALSEGNQEAATGGRLGRLTGGDAGDRIARPIETTDLTSSPTVVPVCSTCGRPSTYRLGMPEPSWCDEHGPKPTNRRGGKGNSCRS